MNEALQLAFKHLNDGNNRAFINSLTYIEAGDINLKNAQGRNLLHQAIKNDLSSEYLLPILRSFPKVNIESQDLSGQSPLTTAATNGNAKAVRILIEHGANRNYRNERGHTAEDLIRRQHGADKELLNALKDNSTLATVKYYGAIASYLAIYTLGVVSHKLVSEYFEELCNGEEECSYQTSFGRMMGM